MDKTILIAIISSFCTLLVALLPYFLRKKESDNEKKTSKTVDIDVELFKFNELKESVDRILANTKADSFLILMAHNGKEELRFATAIYEQHKNNEKTIFSFGATNKYIKVEFDDDYRKMLKTSERDDVVKMETKKMNENLLKGIFISEKINYSNCYFIRRYNEYKAQDKDLLLYCMISSHQDLPYEISDEINFKTFVDFLKNELFV